MRDDDTLNVGDASEIASRGGTLMVLYHPKDGQVVPMHEGEALVIGRARRADVVVSSPALSRAHVRVELVDGQIWAEDLDSTNGTVLNGARISRSAIGLGDELSVGDVAISFQQAAGSASALDSHDGFTVALRQELSRARLFDRELTLLMVRSPGGAVGLSRWCARVQQLLREPVDRLALYGPDTVEILLPELSEETAAKLTRKILEVGREGETQLLCGLSAYPGRSGSEDELVQTAVTALHQATTEAPLQWAPRRDQTGLFPAITVGETTPRVVVNSAMKALYDTVRTVASSTLPVLIVGETGTGKEIVARAVHEEGQRRARPLQVINCGAMPQPLLESQLFGYERGAFTGAERRSPGLFEAAGDGTVFLDEIGELSASAQAALLRVLETKRVRRLGSSEEIEVDVRIVAATHRNLERACDEGGFRRDLFYRLNAMTLRLPPLRERRDEILPLATHFAGQMASQAGRRTPPLDREVRERLFHFDWPGNVRELKNVIDRAVVLTSGQPITVEQLPQRLQPRRRVAASVATGEVDLDSTRITSVISPPEASAPRPPAQRREPPGPQQSEPWSFRERVRRYEAELLGAALEACAGSRNRAAQRLQMPLRTLLNKTAELDELLRRAPPDDDRASYDRLDSQPLVFKQRVKRFETMLIRQALERAGGNKALTARQLGIPPRTLANKLAALDDE